MNRVATATEQSVASQFRSICETLREERFHDRRSKPLGFWVLPSDRRLPLALLSRTIGQLITTPFDDLAATPGIGRKKISSLLDLMRRAIQDGPPSMQTTAVIANQPTAPPNVTDQSPGEFDAHMVSEALWSQWTVVIRELGLGNECIGRVAESLQSIPTVIWTKTLGEYDGLTLSQIRGLRTHGEKRVRCVMEVMHRAYTVSERFRHDSVEKIRRELGSQRILRVANWVGQQILNPTLPTADEIREHLALPILEQIRSDCGETVHTVARQRLGMENGSLSVREQAQSMGVTRARIYQLLEDCHKVVDVRWPQGRVQLDKLTAKLGAQLSTEQVEDPSLFLAVRQLCFPDRSQERQDHRHETNLSPHFFRS